jgi:plastocyanin
LTKSDSTGSWMIRSFTFEPAQIVVYQEGVVTLNFVGVQGDHHEIEVEGIEKFTIHRGEIHTVTFTANKVGMIDYYCHVHMPNMEG